MNRNNLIGKFFKLAFMEFSIAILVIAIVGSFSEIEIAGISRLYVYRGISHSGILQMFTLSCLISIINIIFDSKLLIIRFKLIYLRIIQILLVFGALVLFIFLFKWFPAGNYRVWVNLIIIFSISTAIAMLVSTYFMRKKDKEYKELIKNYKKRMEKKNEYDKCK